MQTENAHSTTHIAFPPQIETQLENLYESEREARQNNNQDLSVKTVEQIMKIVIDFGNPEGIIHVAKNLTSKRGQLIKSSTLIVRACMAYIDRISDQKVKVAFVEDLKTICEKKIYLEVEYARCAMMLVKFKEGNENDLQAAAKIMENVQVETYGSMTKKEKLEFILYQMRIQYLLKDRTRLYIVAKKVNTKTLDEEGHHLLKISYFLYFFHIHLKAKEYDGCSECLERVHEGLSKVQNANELNELDSVITKNFAILIDKVILAESILLFKCLQEHTVTKIDELDLLRAKYEVFLIKSRKVLDLVDAFLSKELTSCDVQRYDAQRFSVLSPSFANHEELFKMLHNQLIKKNLVVVSRYFKNARLKQVADLLDTHAVKVEENLCELVLSNLVRGKIDRPAGYIEFISETNDIETIDAWVKNVNEIVDIIDFVCERIEREEIKAK